MYVEPKRFFIRELLLMLIGFGGFVIIAITSGLGGIGIIIALILNALILLTMIVMFFISAIHFLRRLGDSTNNQPIGMYILNGFFSFFVAAGFLIFYLFLALAGTVVLLPFLQ